jgi:hypothetical protein
METRDISCLAEMEVLQAQVVELRGQLETLRIGKAHRGQSKDISFVAGIKEWTGESKGKSVYDFLTQVETLAKVSGWTNQDKALIVKAKLQALALQFLNGREELGYSSIGSGNLRTGIRPNLCEVCSSDFVRSMHVLWLRVRPMSFASCDARIWRCLKIYVISTRF